ncbi:MAG: hypothetical protein PHT84_00725 [Candidatus Pacebacteria bacterium]|nr:hypothetical protein [Candidatus Paceibacterota bacterium]
MNKLVWLVIIILALGFLFFLNSKKIDDSLNINSNQEEITPNEEEGQDEELGENQEEQKEESDEGEKTEIGDKKLECESRGGEWFSSSNICEINSLSQQACLAQGGEFNECASACRHDPEAEMCTMQCVLTCTFR